MPRGLALVWLLNLKSAKDVLDAVTAAFTLTTRLVSRKRIAETAESRYNIWKQTLSTCVWLREFFGSCVVEPLFQACFWIGSHVSTVTNKQCNRERELKDLNLLWTYHPLLESSRSLVACKFQDLRCVKYVESISYQNNLLIDSTARSLRRLVVEIMKHIWLSRRTLFLQQTSPNNTVQE